MNNPINNNKPNSENQPEVVSPQKIKFVGECSELPNGNGAKKTAGMWMKDIIAPHEYYLGKLLHSNTYGLIIAQPGVGKSAMALHMASCLATGRKCLNWENQKPGGVKVLYIDGEMDPCTIQLRIMREHGLLDNEEERSKFLEYLHIVGKGNFELGEFPYLDKKPKYWLDYVLQHDIKVVIADNMSCLIHDHSKTNDIQTFKGFDENFSFPLRNRNVAFINIYHGGKDISKGARGSSAIIDHCNVTLLLKNEADDESENQNTSLLKFSVHVGKFREERGPDTEPFIASYQNGQWLAESIFLSTQNKVRQEWNRAVDENPTTKPNNCLIAKSIGMEEGTVRYHLKKLEEEDSSFIGPSFFKNKPNKKNNGRQN